MVSFRSFALLTDNWTLSHCQRSCGWYYFTALQ